MAAPQNRKYSSYTTEKAKVALEELLKNNITPADYQVAMNSLGLLLGDVLHQKIPKLAKCLIVSTAEDADYLSRGVLDRLKPDHVTKSAVFWNNHYSLQSGVSIAPVVHKYLEPGYEDSKELVIVKSVISGSCVVRTNLLEVIEQVKPKKIYIVSPVMHKNSENALKGEFSSKISKKFEFIYFAQDAEKDNSTGEVIPGIGGEVYGKLGLSNQPVKVGFIPNLVKELTHMH
ncbi:hypothetical protein [Rosenbergiella nectarea]|uniref:hypothetical protein n=1 Tax=Rosenbergiella nectarea TaxID=988801 RepID=UPI001BD935C7|nr:hypothetical protein [Rosenbergiella nectarea]MBT0731526.1 hypothetical protein [Rosenbergiella nectarea subsp. apis]